MTESTSLMQQLREHVQHLLEHHLRHACNIDAAALEELAFAIHYFEEGSTLNCLRHLKTFSEMMTSFPD